MRYFLLLTALCTFQHALGKVHPWKHEGTRDLYDYVKGFKDGFVSTSQELRVREDGHEEFYATAGFEPNEIITAIPKVALLSEENISDLLEEDDYDPDEMIHPLESLCRIAYFISEEEEYWGKFKPFAEHIRKKRMTLPSEWTKEGKEYLQNLIKPDMLFKGKDDSQNFNKFRDWFRKTCNGDLKNDNARKAGMAVMTLGYMHHSGLAAMAPFFDYYSKVKGNPAVNAYMVFPGDPGAGNSMMIRAARSIKAGEKIIIEEPGNDMRKHFHKYGRIADLPRPYIFHHESFTVTDDSGYLTSVEFRNNDGRMVHCSHSGKHLTSSIISKYQRMMSKLKAPTKEGGKGKLNAEGVDEIETANKLRETMSADLRLAILILQNPVKCYMQKFVFSPYGKVGVVLYIFFMWGLLQLYNRRRSKGKSE